MQKSPLQQSNLQPSKTTQSNDYINYSSINNIPCPQIKIITPDRSSNQHTMRSITNDTMFTPQTIKKTYQYDFKQKENVKEHLKEGTIHYKSLIENHCLDYQSAPRSSNLKLEMLTSEVERLKMLCFDQSVALSETQSKLNSKEEIDQHHILKLQQNSETTIQRQIKDLGQRHQDEVEQLNETSQQNRHKTQQLMIQLNYKENSIVELQGRYDQLNDDFFRLQQESSRINKQNSSLVINNESMNALIRSYSNHSQHILVQGDNCEDEKDSEEIQRLRVQVENIKITVQLLTSQNLKKEQQIQLLKQDIERINFDNHDLSGKLILMCQQNNQVNKKCEEQLFEKENTEIRLWENRMNIQERKYTRQNIEDQNKLQSSHEEYILDLKVQYDGQLMEIEIMNNVCKAKLQERVYECSILKEAINQQRRDNFEIDDLEKKHSAEIVISLLQYKLGYSTSIMTLNNSIIHKDFEIRQLISKLNSHESKTQDTQTRYKFHDQNLEIEQLQELIKDQEAQISIYNENLLRYSNKIKHHESEIAFQTSQLEDKELWMNNYQQLLDQLKQEKEVQRFKNMNLAKKIRQMSEVSEQTDLKVAEQDIEIQLLKQRIEDIKQSKSKQWKQVVTTEQ